MSAGGISYSGIVGYGKATLPSVDSWSSNLNILRNPPSSITTRKIDKVGETSEITQMVQDSGDRACEAINVYARGVNPMVGVSYDNFGNNGGQRVFGRANNNSGGATNRQSFLPYRVMRDGAFRPPILDARELFPLSRLPRVWTSSFTQPGFADFSKKAMCPGTDKDTKGVKTPNQILKTCARPTATYKYETPVVEPFQARYVIRNPLQIKAESGKQTKARFNGKIGTPTAQILNNPMKVEKNVSQGLSSTRKQGETNVRTERYTHDALQGEMMSNISQNVQVTPIDKLLDVKTERYTHGMLRGDNREVVSNVSQNVQITPIDQIFNTNSSNGVRDIQTISRDAPVTSYSNYEYIHKDVELGRVLPQYEARTNVGENIFINPHENAVEERVYNNNRPVVNIDSGNYSTAYISPGYNDIGSREYVLKPTINVNRGDINDINNNNSGMGYQVRGRLPQPYQDNEIPNIDPLRHQMRSQIFEMQQQRNIDLGNIPYEVPNIPHRPELNLGY